MLLISKAWRERRDRKMAVRRARMAYMVYSLVLFILGIVLIIKRNISANVMGDIIGGVILACGICKILLYFVNDTYGLAFQFDFALGIFSIIVGIILLTQPYDTAEHISAIVGIFIIVDGSFKLQTSQDAKKFGMKYWVAILALAAITTIGGLLLAISQVSQQLVPVGLVGIALILDGIENFYIATYTIKLVKRFRNKERKGVERND